MAQQNNDNSGAGMIFGLIALCAGMLFIFVYFLFVFAAFALTIFCLFAWNKPRRLGNTIVPPEEARKFVAHGLIGFATVTLAVFFGQFAFDYVIQPDFWIYIYLGSYAGGSLGVEMLLANADNEATQPSMHTKPAAQIIPPDRPEMRVIAGQVRGHAQGQNGNAIQSGQAAHSAQGAGADESFRFATWDDEEEFK